MKSPLPSFVVTDAYRYSAHKGLHHWRVNVGILSLLVVAPSHQAAKMTALGHWTEGRTSQFATNLDARILKVGIKARREMRDCTAIVSPETYS